MAKNIVAAKLARKCEVQVAYAIGVDKPVSINIDTFGTGVYSDNEIKKAVLKLFNFTPKAMRTEIIKDDASFKALAEYGHIGREDIDVPWERTSKAYVLKVYCLEQYGK